MCACTCPKRRNINIAVPANCILSPVVNWSSVNKCITICTPSIYGCINGSPCTPTYLVCDAGTINGYRVAIILWFAVNRSIDYPCRNPCDILRHSYGISFYSELAQEHSIRAYDLAFDLTTGRVYPFSSSLLLDKSTHETNTISIPSLI